MGTGDLVPSLDPAAAYFAAVGNFVGTWRTLVSALPTGAVAEVAGGGAVLVASGVPAWMFNLAFVLDEAEPDVNAILTAAVDFFADHHVPFSVRMHQSLADEFAAAADRYGLVRGGRSPLMVMDPIPSIPSLPDGTTVHVVDGADALATHRDVAARGFGAPHSMMEMFLPDDVLHLDAFRAVVISNNGVPASTAALVDAGGLAGIYNVATPEEHRRRGLGEAATWAAVALGAERGHTVATLQASEMGRPIYERMGFRTVAWWCAFTTS